MAEAETLEIPPGISWGMVSAALGKHMADNGEWCGVPIPLPGEQLVVEPKNPWADKIRDLQDFVNQEAGKRVITDRRPTTHTCTDDDLAWHPVNSWWSKRLGCNVMIARHERTGKTVAIKGNYALATKMDLLVRTIGAAEAWSLAAEYKAIEKLGELIKPHLWRAYQTTGAFLEHSRRSGLVYVFRRSRPTIVIKAEANGRLRLMTALCLHPIGFYLDSWAGSMTPTDEVIAHLMLMRGDEVMFWRRSNQHDPARPEAGL